MEGRARTRCPAFPPCAESSSRFGAELYSASCAEPGFPGCGRPRGVTSPAGTVLADRAGVLVVVRGDVVEKTHAPATDPEALRVRLEVAAHPLLRGVLLAPLPVGDTGALTAPEPDGRLRTRWPRGLPVAPDDPDAAPWTDAARLLARLHTVPADRLPGPLPAARGPRKVALALGRMRAALDRQEDDPPPGQAPGTRAGERTADGAVPRSKSGPARESPCAARRFAAPHRDLAGPLLPALRRAAGDVEKAAAGLPDWATGQAPSPRADALCHGDLHLGQLVRHPAHGPWLLIDIDDMGVGDPAWDLARPAAWFAAGILAPEVWARFLARYLRAGGNAVRHPDDPWAELDVPARALTVQTAALGLVRAAAAGRLPDPVEQAVLDACARMARQAGCPTDVAGSVG